MERGKVIRTDGIRLPDGQDMKKIDEAGYTYLGIHTLCARICFALNFSNMALLNQNVQKYF